MANLVNLESVSHAFGTRVLLDGVSLGVGAGEVIGVVGRNGDGKTTLLRVLTGDLVPFRASDDLELRFHQGADPASGRLPR